MGSGGAALRKVHRGAHLDRLSRLQDEGRLILAGPFSDGSGSVIVMKASSLEDAQRFAKEDPYVSGGVFIRVEVKPFKQVFPKVFPEGLKEGSP